MRTQDVPRALHDLADSIQDDLRRNQGMKAWDLRQGFACPRCQHGILWVSPSDKRTGILSCGFRGCVGPPIAADTIPCSTCEGYGRISGAAEGVIDRCPACYGVGHMDSEAEGGKT